MSDAIPSHPDAVVYAWGLLYCSVCALTALTPEQVVAHVNVSHPTGLANGWRVDPEGVFASGHPNPCACTSDADRRHWLLSC